MVAPTLPNMCVVPCQPCRASCAVPSVLGIPLKLHTSVCVLCAVLCQLARHVSEPWGLGYGLFVHAKGVCCVMFKQARLLLRLAVPRHAMPCHAALSACAMPGVPGPCGVNVLSVSCCSAVHARPCWPCRGAYAVHLCCASGLVEILSVLAPVLCCMLANLNGSFQLYVYFL